MIESYISSVSSLYFPLLFSFGTAFLAGAAISPLLGSPAQRPRPLGAIFLVTLLLASWPLVLPGMLAGASALAIIGGSTFLYERSSRIADSPQYQDFLLRLKGLFPL